MRPTTRAFVIAGLSYAPVLIWLSLIPVIEDRLPLGALILCAIGFLGLSVVALVWASFAMVLSYRDTPRRRRAAFLGIAVGFFALPWATWLLLAATG